MSMADFADTPEPPRLIDLEMVVDDPTWPTGDERVARMRDSIRRGSPRLGPLTVGHVLHEDGAWQTQIIDGPHRYRALRLEGVRRWYAWVIEYLDPREAYYDRIQTSLDDIGPRLLHERALVALRDGFAHDMAALVRDKIFYEPAVDDTGARIAVPRADPLPEEPLELLGALLDHVQALSGQQPALDWERAAVEWLDAMAARFRRPRAWLRDEVLRITALVADDIPGRTSDNRVRDLSGISSTRVRRVVIGRLRWEPQLTDARLRFALDWLGCGPDVDKQAFLHRRSEAEMISMLGSTSLDTLASRMLAAASAHEERQRPSGVPGAAPPAPPAPPAPSGPGNSPPAAAADEVVEPFTTVAPGTIGLGREQRGAAPAEDWAPIHDLIVRLLERLELFGRHEGDWRRADVRRDLIDLGGRIARFLEPGTRPGARPAVEGAPPAPQPRQTPTGLEIPDTSDTSGEEKS